MDFLVVLICFFNFVSKKKIYVLDVDVNFVKYGLNDSVCVVIELVCNGILCGVVMSCCCLSFLIFDGGNFVLNCIILFV